MTKPKKSDPKPTKQARNLAELPAQPDPAAPLEMKLLLRALAPVLKRLETDLLGRANGSASVRERLEAEHKRQVAAQRSADEYPQFLQAFVEQVAAAWVLACVFVRTLEDRGLLKQNRLAGPGASDSLREFLSLAPSLSERDYLELCLRELLHQPAAEPLFGPHNPLWLLAPSAEVARALLEVFRAPNADAPALRFGQADTRFLGDLYQDLNENVRARYALLQTPKFIEDYILDRTLEPAVERFGLDHATLIDPTCGSGHFLIGAFERLFAKHQRAAPNELPTVVAERALSQVYGTDINPYAVAISRFRLTLAFLEQTGLDKLSKAPKLALNVGVADSLLHSPRGDALQKTEANGKAERRWFSLEDEQTANELLNPTTKFAAVVGNPPYITVKDTALRELYRKAYASAAGTYSMGVPFTERFFELSRSEGRVGMITANSFMKREFGKKLIAEFLPTVDLDFIVNSAGAYIPGHGTPTVLLFGTQRKPRGKSVLSVLGKRGEPTTPADPSEGLVWSSIRDHGEQVGYEDDYISVAKISRDKLAEHPWSLAGGGAEELKALLEERADKRLGDVIDGQIGRAARTGEDSVYMMPPHVASRLALPDEWVMDLVVGEDVRDWSLASPEKMLFPYNRDSGFRPFGVDACPRAIAYLWPFKAILRERATFQGKMEDAGREWFEYMQYTASANRTPLSIAFAFVATHNHFVLDRGGKVFNRSAPIIKLPEGATEDDHLALLAYLNSSTACFWMKQVFYPKGGDQQGEGGRVSATTWEDRFEFAGTGLAGLPLPHGMQALAPLGRRLAVLAERLAAASADGQRVKTSESSGDDESAGSMRDTFLAEMVRLQESLDWSVYRMFGLPVDDACTRPDLQDRIGARLVEERVWSRAPEGGADIGWFRRGGYPTPPAAIETQIRAARRSATRDKYVSFLEALDFKRWWRVPQAEIAWERALRRVSLSSLEKVVEEASSLVKLSSLVAAVSAMRMGALEDAAANRGVQVPPFRELLTSDAVPFFSVHRYTDAGLAKYRQWQATWELQRREDGGEKIARIPVPPKYDQKDFRKPEYWRLRGKLDVPKERFISYPGLESDEDQEPLYGWAGWDHAQRARVLVELYQERKDNEAWSAERLTPALAGLHELLPWVKQWHNEPDPAYDGARFGDDLAAFLAEELRLQGLTEAKLLAWRPEDKQRATKTLRKAGTRTQPSQDVPRALRQSEPANDNKRSKPRKKGAAR